MTEPKPNVICTSDGARMFGTRCFHITRRFDAPSATDATTKSRSRIASTWPRATRA
jgi:hypothetical protein